jgi:alanine racemase
MADCGDDEISVGDEIVLIGAQGSEEITATEIAEKVGTINYEVVCSIGPRVPRLYV